MNHLERAAIEPGGAVGGRSERAVEPGGRGEMLKVAAVLAAIILATVVAYSPVLFNFFAGDDFVHLTWLKEAIRNHELIWRNFHSSWLDGTTTRFYRPLISVFMVADYALWGLNGLGFHLTNLSCHLASTVLLFFIVRHLATTAGAMGPAETAAADRWALAAAGLFGLYPLHPEAVSWITGRVDSIVTMFCLSSLWCYMRWRAAGGPLWLSGSLFSMVLGLLSKEMAVTLPPLFVCYELTMMRPAATVSPARRLVQMTAATAPFWLTLALYFVVRRLALGTFVGGYDDSLFFVSNWKLFLGGWVHGIRMMLVPLNKDLMGAHHLVTRGWEITVVAAAACGLITAVTSRRLVAAVAFTASWLLLSLIPVYKIFAIADDLQGSRLAYLATVPLAVLLTVAVAGVAGDRPWRRRLHRLATLAVVGLLAAAGAALYINNQSWRRAGLEANAIRAALETLYKATPGDPQVLAIALPDNIAGAYTCRNALWGMTKAPQLHRDISNCLMLDRFEPILPFGFLKDSILQSKKDIHIYRWAGQPEGFVPVELAGADSSPGSPGKALKDMLAPVDKPGTTFRFNADGTLSATGGAGSRGRPEALIRLEGKTVFRLTSSPPPSPPPPRTTAARLDWTSSTPTT